MLAVLFSVIGFTAYNLVLKRVVMAHPAHPVAITAAVKLLAAACLIPGVLLEPLVIPALPQFWALLALNTAIWTVENILDIHSFRLSAVSRLMLIRSALPALGFLLGIALFTERATLARSAGTLLVVAGIIVLYAGRGRFHTDRGGRMQLGATVLMACGAATDKYLIGHFSLLFYLFINFILLPGPMLLLQREGRANFRAFFGHVRNFVPFLLPALLLAGSALLIMVAYRTTDFSLVLPLSNSGTALTALGGMVLLHERSEVGRTVLALVVSAGGVLLLSL